MTRFRRASALLPPIVVAICLATATGASATGGVPILDGGAPLYAEQNLAVNGEGGFPNYRIPALTTTPNGDLLASYDGRPTAIDAPGPNSILQRRSTDGGRTWGDQTVVAAGKTTQPIKGYSDPSYLVDRQTGAIFNFHVYSQNQGFLGSRPGTDPADPNVLHANVASPPMTATPGPIGRSRRRSRQIRAGAAGSPRPARASSSATARTPGD